eukprot:11367899-Alexandrium_andersonii.AAC.1
MPCREPWTELGKAHAENYAWRCAEHRGGSRTDGRAQSCAKSHEAATQTAMQRPTQRITMR